MDNEIIKMICENLEQRIKALEQENEQLKEQLSRALEELENN